MLTWHPFGLHHGPQPAARERDAAAAAAADCSRRMADEVAVMIDARHALQPGEASKDLDVEGYARSWSPDA
jgi:homogentisate 1,2-dioxygenase